MSSGRPSNGSRREGGNNSSSGRTTAIGGGSGRGVMSETTPNNAGGGAGAGGAAGAGGLLVPGLGGGGGAVAGLRERIELHSSREPSPSQRDGQTAATTLSPNSTALLATLGAKSLKPKANVRSARSSRDSSPTRQERRPLRSSNLSPAPGALHSKSPASGPQQQTQADSSAPLSPRPYRPQQPGWQGPGRLSVTPTPPPSTRSPALSPTKREFTTPLSSAVVTSSEKTTPEHSEAESTAGTRTPRGGLETVIESSLPSTPAIGTSRTLGENQTFASAIAAAARNRSERIPEHAPANFESEKERPPRLLESESESGYRSGEKQPLRRPTASHSKAFARRMAPQADTSSSMTVETETVTAMPNPGNVGTSLRSKRSNDTIRAPKKEKKRTKKPTTVAAVNPSSRAEMFAARIAEAVDDADSSDSDETFVYESNPREPPQRPSSRFHSRTPSATSIGGASDSRARPLPLYDNVIAQAGKTKMKFVNPYSRDGVLSDTGEGYGGFSSNDMREAGPSNGGRHNRLMVEDSRLDRQGNTLRRPPSHLSSRNSSRPASPRVARPGMNGKKQRMWARYDGDVDDTDERLPLITRPRGNVRNRRNGIQPRRSRNGWLGSFAGCFIALSTLLFVFSGALTFFFTTTKSLQEVHVVNITDIVASNEEIMLNLVVSAINPNVIAVTVKDMDVNVFARSSYGREPDKDPNPPKDGEPEKPKDPNEPDDPWGPNDRQKASRRALAPTLLHKDRSAVKARDNRDDGTNPDPLPGDDKQNMLLGRLKHFNSPLIFEGSPLNRNPSIASGEIRVAHPGNETEVGGSERWERILQHPFQLIVRGFLKYSIPLSNRERSVSIIGKVMVSPDTGEGGAAWLDARTLELEVKET